MWRVWRCRWWLRLSLLKGDATLFSMTSSCYAIWLQKRVASPFNKRAQVLSDRPRILLIAPHNSYRIAPYIQAAQKLNLDVLVVSQGKYSLVSEVAAGVHVDFGDLDQALKQISVAINKYPVTGIVGTDDLSVTLASTIGKTLGLPHNPPEAALLSRRKDLARAQLKESGLPVPDHTRIHLDRYKEDIGRVHYPCVIKPVSLSGSRGVIRADNDRQFLEACERISAILSREQHLPEEERKYALVEEFISGPEFAVEGLLRNGNLQVLALFDKPDPLEGPYFEETYYITPSRLEPHLQEVITRCVSDACAAYGLQEGPVHAEVRLHEQTPYIMEVAARTIGGQCARLLQFGTGHSLEELVLSHAVGNFLPIKKDMGAAGVLMIPVPQSGILRRVEGIMQALKVPFIDDVEISVREGYELVPLPEGASYLGFIFARAPTPEQVEKSLRDAHAHLKFIIAPVLDVQCFKGDATLFYTNSA